MSAPLVVNTKDGVCWTRRTVTSSGIALYAPEGVCKCPEFVMATLAELAEHGIAGSADVLPVPVGPEQPPFPPAPRTFEEKLRQDVARLQGLLAEAVRDAHRARSERDLIRERVSEPFGCKFCGVEKRSHGRRYIGGQGMHAWERPSDEQVKARMLARRVARSPLPAVPELEQLHDDLTGAYLARWEEEQDNERLRWALASAKRGRARLRAQVAALLEERRSTNEALDDAVQELRANAQHALPWAHVMPDGDLSGFLNDLVSAAMGRWQSDPEVPDREVLAAVEKACADWRTPGEGYRSDAESDECPCPPADQPHQVGCLFDGVPVSPPSERPVDGLRASLEDPHDGPLAHPHRIPRDLPSMDGSA